MKRSPALPLLVSALALACQEGPSTGPERVVPSVAAPQFAFVNGPNELPNVFRFEGQFATGIQDPETDLFAFAGLPDSPKMSAACLGGTEPFATVDIQFVGELQEVIHRLVVGGDVNLHVYRLTGFMGFCRSTPIAQGIGRVMNTDNDLLALTSGFPGADAWGFRMNGQVTLTTAVGGGDAHLVAHNRFIIWPDGDFRRIYRKVDLSAR
jgi:hypothetical protein